MAIEFPDPRTSNEDGLVAMGGNLEVETLLAAYRKGIFPWYGDQQPVLWWSPDPRCVLLPDEFYCNQRLLRRLRQPCYHFSRDQAFERVIRTCADIPRKGEKGTWIWPEMIQAYLRLHQGGFAHSIEVWRDTHLIGGVYGVLLNDVFFAESMFSHERDASKMALAKLVQRAMQQGWKLIDCQFLTSHLASLGAREISREMFLRNIGQGGLFVAE
ncbi:MAG: leucyl/phenylalanyl-tRNA--protein transferase [Zetaproteobacteria bacterium CG02_land_8_20_14_3_00_50_9]|nr:MAG: leucyl/phenylalanyl-tRNA--protein transferase [Zetaproteobacteria bacterium CG1_02_49_23]PIQ32365.1 MAG: leucyl/phenylalanyl-tRNA--protein transferase [Zetaproteobacteria bacterium CG17_big_fil_post_rev_8_21_14_2_50_50_13]PIV31242.1 MAG: leucyl/phenylalanyl-tRNA--protein transferase [Zetaproteobacteria bacterium CG02_land_8_20_14_3_00_50_9]PIY56808.1 MAG: leucyl/phenylalanyl-tRNA--protein transferase [Zetaproteobacteria bacterium CG_4_10_14_0_8_um_filter_49_80]